MRFVLEEADPGGLHVANPTQPIAIAIEVIGAASLTTQGGIPFRFSSWSCYRCTWRRGDAEKSGTGPWLLITDGGTEMSAR